MCLLGTDRGRRAAAGRNFGDVVASAFLQTPQGRTPSDLRGAATRLYVAGGKVAILGKELKA